MNTLTITIFLFLLCSCLNSEPPTIKIKTDKKISSTHEEFLSVSFDTAQIVGSYFWDKEGDIIGGRGKNKIPPLDLADPVLIERARMLMPGYIRIGGSESEAVYYNIKGNQKPDRYDSEFTIKKLDEIEEFSKKTGLKVFFTLNHGPSSFQNQKWQSDNHMELLNYLSQKKYDWKFELGNEVFAQWAVFGADYQPSEKVYAKNYLKMKSLLKKRNLKASLAGPASAYWPVIGEPLGFWYGSTENLIPELKEKIDIISWHYYPTQSFRCPVAIRRMDKDDLITPKYLDEVSVWARKLKETRDQYAPESELWLGETGSAQCGGEPGVSDKYINALWWIDQLGQLAKLEHKVVIRQNLIGADYALLNRDGSPRPDYYASLLWKKYMGRNVLEVDFDNQGSDLRFYAHCSKFGNGAVLLAINLSKDFQEFQLEGFPGDKFYDVLEAGQGLYGNSVLFNGKKIVEPVGLMDNKWNVQQENNFRLTPHSLTFIQILGQFKGC
ncbi:MAG: hypothetical protein CME62_00930 [Halobacteriovoraceae bacterium]|nr:hypothetical protein [Halobacteriovoraceae bacterium]|tara:strand:- start:4791 stop:6278 length:1488 start_codon:yes stop_codon:yes gene_type:complete